MHHRTGKCFWFHLDGTPSEACTKNEQGATWLNAVAGFDTYDPTSEEQDLNLGRLHIPRYLLKYFL